MTGCKLLHSTLPLIVTSNPPSPHSNLLGLPPRPYSGRFSPNIRPPVRLLREPHFRTPPSPFRVLFRHRLPSHDPRRLRRRHYLPLSWPLHNTVSAQGRSSARRRDVPDCERGWEGYIFACHGCGSGGCARWGSEEGEERE